MADAENQNNSPFSISQEEIDKLLNLEEVRVLKDVEKSSEKNFETLKSIEKIVLQLEKIFKTSIDFIGKDYYKNSISEFSKDNVFNDTLIVEINYFLPEKIYFVFDLFEFKSFLNDSDKIREQAKEVSISIINTLLKNQIDLKDENLYLNIYTDFSFLPQEERFEFLVLKIENEENKNLLNIIQIFTTNFFTLKDNNKKNTNKGVEEMSEDINNFLDSVPSEDSANPSGSAKHHNSKPTTNQPEEAKIQKAAFQNFAESNNNLTEHLDENNNIEMLMDIPMEISVELGRTKKKVEEILMLNEGSIIELSRIAGEPIDLFVNGKILARGEVIVIEENFGIRITEIISYKDRLKMYDV